MTTLSGNVFLSEASGTGRTLTIGGTGTVEISGNISNFNGVGGTAGNLTLADPGIGNLHTITLSGDNSYSGNTTENIRTILNINSATALGTSTLVANSGITIDNTSANAITLTNADNISLSGGSLTFTGTNDLSFGNNTVTMSAANRTITTTGATLTIGAIAQDASPRNFTKAGGGTLVLLGNSTYTGATSVSGGTLRVDGSIAAGTGVTVSNAGTVLGGTGTINESVAVGTNGAILGGTGAAATGTLTVNNGSLTLNSTSIVELALGASGAHSTLAHTGTGGISFQSNQQFTFIDLGAQATFYDNIITGTGLGSLDTTGWTVSNPGWTYSFALDGTGNIDLTVTAVPEPSTWIGGAAAGLSVLGYGLLGRRRFAKRSRVIV
jgi:autotransporter-associated beta strand protein